MRIFSDESILIYADRLRMVGVTAEQIRDMSMDDYARYRTFLLDGGRVPKGLSIQLRLPFED